MPATRRGPVWTPSCRSGPLRRSRPQVGRTTVMPEPTISISEAARRSGVPESTLKRWAEQRVLPVRGGWTAAAAAQARVVARMRERGHSLREIRGAVRDGRLAFGSVEDLLPAGRAAPLRGPRRPRPSASRRSCSSGSWACSAPRWRSPTGSATTTSRRSSSSPTILRNGFPLVALLQLVRVYAQSLRKIAEAEVRLFHLFVHEPMIREGMPPLEMAEEMEGMAARADPARRAADGVHPRPLPALLHGAGRRRPHGGRPAADPRHPDRVSMAFCFVDLTGFTRYTAEEGDEEALDLVERFVETVEATLPAEATIVKTIGDEVMIVSPDPTMLTEWAVGFLTLFDERPQPRTGIHFGEAVYRDGDYFGARRQPRPPGRRPGARPARSSSPAPVRRRDRADRVPGPRADRRARAEGLPRAVRAVRRRGDARRGAERRATADPTGRWTYHRPACRARPRSRRWPTRSTPPG